MKSQFLWQHHLRILTSSDFPALIASELGPSRSPHQLVPTTGTWICWILSVSFPVLGRHCLPFSQKEQGLVFQRDTGLSFPSPHTSHKKTPPRPPAQPLSHGGSSQVLPRPLQTGIVPLNNICNANASCVCRHTGLGGWQGKIYPPSPKKLREAHVTVLCPFPSCVCVCCRVRGTLDPISPDRFSTSCIRRPLQAEPTEYTQNIPPQVA